MSLDPKHVSGLRRNLAGHVRDGAPRYVELPRKLAQSILNTLTALERHQKENTDA